MFFDFCCRILFIAWSVARSGGHIFCQCANWAVVRLPQRQWDAEVWGISRCNRVSSGERLYESPRAVNIGWRFTARPKYLLRDRSAWWTNIFEKRQLHEWGPVLAALPGAERREGAQPHEFVLHMTRRAFLALRVIQAQGKFRSKGLVKNCGFWFRKMKISQNLWIRLRRDQFSYLP